MCCAIRNQTSVPLAPKYQLKKRCNWHLHAHGLDEDKTGIHAVIVFQENIHTNLAIRKGTANRHHLLRIVVLYRINDVGILAQLVRLEWNVSLSNANYSC